MIKGKKYLKKQAVASVLALSMAAASLTGCSNGLSSSKKESSNVGTMTQEEASTTKVMVIGDYDIYMDELLVYAIQAMVTNNGTLASVKANPDTYKEQTLSLIRTTKILYDVTQHNDVTLDDSDMETTNNTIDNFLGFWRSMVSQRTLSARYLQNRHMCLNLRMISRMIWVKRCSLI